MLKYLLGSVDRSSFGHFHCYSYHQSSGLYLLSNIYNHDKLLFSIYLYPKWCPFMLSIINEMAFARNVQTFENVNDDGKKRVHGNWRRTKKKYMQNLIEKQRKPIQQPHSVYSQISRNVCYYIFAMDCCFCSLLNSHFSCGVPTAHKPQQKLINILSRAQLLTEQKKNVFYFKLTFGVGAAFSISQFIY